MSDTRRDSGSDQPVYEASIFAANVYRFIANALTKKGAVTSVCAAVGIDRKTLQRYSDISPSKGSRDIVTTYGIIRALGFDPINIFLAAQRSDSLPMMLFYAAGDVVHRPAPELTRVVLARDGHGVEIRRLAPPERIQTNSDA